MTFLFCISNFLFYNGLLFFFFFATTHVTPDFYCVMIGHGASTSVIKVLHLGGNTLALRGHFIYKFKLISETARNKNNDREKNKTPALVIHFIL